MSKAQTSIKTEDGRVFYDMAVADNPCFACGACCYHYRVSFYHGELDSQPGGFVPADLTSPVTPFLACMRGTENGHSRCIALQDNGHCSIYAQRPSTCREFPAYTTDGDANPECNRLRKIYGLPLRK